MRRPIKHNANSHVMLAEEARRNLPIGVYLMMLDEAARTGVMPIVGRDGKPTGEAQELKPEQRIDLAKFLINKILPDVPKEVYHMVAAPREADQMPLDKLPSASADALKAIAAGTMQVNDATFTVAKPDP